MRILNREALVGHGNVEGRRIVADVMEAGLQAADPWRNAGRLLRREGRLLRVGDPAFEATGDPHAGESIYDLDEVENIYVVGAGKGVQRAALAIEDALGERLTGGCVIAKRGDPVILKHIRVVHGGHPIPDEGCVEGCKAILELAARTTARDLVFTIIGNGGSSLLTMPEEGIALEDVRELTRFMQIERGASTVDLNVIRNHIDQLKGGKIARRFSAAQCVHIVMCDANHHVVQQPRHDYDGLMRHNVWLHNLPEGSTFGEAMEILRRYDAVDHCPPAILDFLRRARPEQETVKYEEFSSYRFRVFGIMPDDEHFIPAVVRRAGELGIPCRVLNRLLHAEASECGKVYGSIARNISDYGEPFPRPMMLVSTGEMLVTVRGEKGVGGRNQEFVLQCALEITGDSRIVVGSADSDGTDGPGGLDLEGAPDCLGGGIVDGYTLAEARKQGVDLLAALRTHDVSRALWRLDCGMHIEQNISLDDLTVLYIGE